ncbi:MAG: glycine/sarcosine/betaine reductase component B subunit, partial [Bacillota bacterium]
MRLELGRLRIRDVQFASSTRVAGGVLYVDRAAVEGIVCKDERIARASVEIARPGERVRIIPVKDVIEPRVKVRGAGGIFPGLVSKVETVGDGRTHVLSGAAVVTVGKIVGFQEGIIDMAGPGAEYTPFSGLNNLVIVCEPVADLPPHEHEAAIRLAGLKVAAYLGEAGRNVEPDEVDIYECLPLPEQVKAYPGLPRVAYVYMLQSQGLMHDTYVYGVDAKKILPTLIYPTEVMDGAIVSGNCVSACDKNTTYHHQNSPVIHDLLARHGRDINFVGVVITNENVTLSDKERSSSFASKLVEMLGAEGAIVSEEGFGNPDADLMMNCVKLEKRDIKTVLLTDEYAGR